MDFYAVAAGYQDATRIPIDRRSSAARTTSMEGPYDSQHDRLRPVRVLDDRLDVGRRGRSRYTDHVQIQSGHTVSIDNNNAVCNWTAVVRGEQCAHRHELERHAHDLRGHDAGGTSHVAFSAGWSSTDAYLKFPALGSDAFRMEHLRWVDLAAGRSVIDKSGGKVVTDGTAMRLGIRNQPFPDTSNRGSFELDEGDDIEGRWASSGTFTNAALPTVTIEAGGIFGHGGWRGRASHAAAASRGHRQLHRVRRSAVPGRSTYGLDFLGGMDVEVGRMLVVSVGIGDGDVSTAAPWWSRVRPARAELHDHRSLGRIAVLQLNSGGLFESKTATTIFPVSFVNNGKVRYSRDAGRTKTGST